MQKQAMYDAGIQKIQSEIDNVAGLDIMRQVDKNYLQTKLNELGGNLTALAAGDFSNFQLVNSVSGMTKQVVKDSVVQNAVSSTSWYRKQMQLRESLQKEGKTATSNDWDFNLEVNKWMDDLTPGKSFNSTYNPYTNWKKNSLEVIKNLTGDSTITDDAFTTDSNGNLVISDAIVRKKMAGISPEKIQQALLVGLTPNDFKQMEIDGRYNYSNIDNPTFIKNVDNSYEDKISFFTNQKTVLENAMSSTNSVVEKEKLRQNIESLNKTLNSLNSEYNGIKQTIEKGDIESAKARLFTIDALSGFSKAFSHTETSLTYENSPFADMQMRRDIKNMEWKKFTMDYNQREKFHKDEQENKRLEREQKTEENRLKKLEIEGYGGLPGSVDPSLVPQYTLDKLVTEVNANQKILDDYDNAFLQKKGKDKTWLDQQFLSWEQRPGSVDPEISRYFSSTSDIRRKLNADQKMITDANKIASSKYGSIDDFIPKDRPNVTTVMGDGKEYTYTSKDFVNFNSLYKNYVEVGEVVSGATPSVTYLYDKAKQELPDKLYQLFLAKTKKQKSPNENLMLEYAENYRKAVNVPYSKVLNNVIDETSKIVNERLTTSQGVSYGVPVASAAQKTSIANVLTRFANLADQQKGGIANSPNWNSETARKLALEENTNYALTVIEGTERQPSLYQLDVSGKSGKVSLKITPEQKISIFGQRWEASPAVQAIRPYQEQIRKMGGYSTAPDPKMPTTQSNSYLNITDFPNIGTYGVKGNLVNIGGDAINPLYVLKLAVYDPTKKSWIPDITFPRSGVLTQEAVAPAMAGLTDGTLFELLNEKPATAKDINLLKSASKKPL